MMLKMEVVHSNAINSRLTPFRTNNTILTCFSVCEVLVVMDEIRPVKEFCTS